MNRVACAILLVCGFGLVASAAAPTLLPFRFSAGTPIKSSEVNANFDALASADGDLRTEISELRSQLDSLRSQLGLTQITQSNTNTNVVSIVDRLVVLETNTAGIATVGSDVLIEGRNLIVRDGPCDSPIACGVGNIIVGRECSTEYSEENGCDPIRTGSNNVVIGGNHQYTACGSLLVGECNSAEADGSVVFGKRNRATGCVATVCGGEQNTACGAASAVGGGNCRNVTSDMGWEVGNQSNSLSGGFLPELRARRFVNR